jgi:hypothetical protein
MHMNFHLNVHRLDKGMVALMLCSSPRQLGLLLVHDCVP